MFTLPRQTLLLLLALVMGQWLAVLHAGEHPLLDNGSAHTCAICLHQHDNSAALPSAAPVAPTQLGSAAPALHLAAWGIARLPTDLRICGPPLFLV